MAEDRIERAEGVGRTGMGADVDPRSRPGVPMYAKGVRPLGRGRGAPVRQGDDPRHLRRLGLKRLTPVYGTANPPHGLSGVMRRWAYGYPENLARHWMILLMADRVDVVEDRIGGVLERPLAAAGMPGLGRRIRRNPLAALAVLGAAGWLARRALR